MADKLFKILCLVLCLVLSGGWLAHAQTDPAETVPSETVLPESNDAAPRDVIRLATVNANFRVALEELGRKYEQMHPNISVEIQIVAQNFETWIRTSIAGGGDLVPDLYNPNYTPNYDKLGKWTAMNDYLMEVNPYSGLPWHETFDMPLLERYKSSGSYYQIPMDNIAIAIYYNKDIFEELGLGIPETWDEWMATCQTIKDAGIIPIGISGTADMLWAGDLGWLFMLLTDAYIRDQVPLVVARPGDWDYDPTLNADYVYKPGDIYNDLLVTMSEERILQAVKSKEISPVNPGYRQVYVRIKELAEYFQPGYLGSPAGSAVSLFYRQKAAMMLATSGSVTGIIRDFKRFDEDERFDYGNFFFPTITDDPLVQGPFRGVGGAGMALAMTKTDDPVHERNVVDFLMYLTCPESAQFIIEKTMEEDQPFNGPMAIKGIKLDPELDEAFKAFQGHGFCKLEFRGLRDEQDSVAEWCVITQEYLGDQMELDDYVQAYEDILVDAVPRVAKVNGYDLDPTTKNYPPRALNAVLREIDTLESKARKVATKGSGQDAFTEYAQEKLQTLLPLLASKIDEFMLPAENAPKEVHPELQCAIEARELFEQYEEGQIDDAGLVSGLIDLGERFTVELGGSQRNKLNPFENGSLMVAIIMGIFALFGLWHISRVHGAARKRTLVAYLLLFPTFMLLGAFNYFPALSGLYHAFTEWEPGAPAVFNGLDNFRMMMDDQVFIGGIGNMFILMIAGLVKATLVPFIAAEMILFLVSDRLRYWVRTLFLLPMVVPAMVGILIWKFIYDPNMGLLNQALKAIGLGHWQHSWLGEPNLALPSIIFMGFPWIGALGLLIFMAGLMAIPSSVYESFRMESESILRRIWEIDLPLVRGQFRLLVIITFIGALQDFQSVLILTDGGPGLATNVPALRMYHVAFRFSHYGYGAALGFVLFLVVLGITIINMRLIKKAEVD